jgi:hypothetical protein
MSKWDNSDRMRSYLAAGVLYLEASTRGLWSVYVDSEGLLREAGRDSSGRVEGATPDERLAAAKAAAEAWCRTMARAVLVEVGDE